MNISLNWTGFLGAIIFVGFMMGSVAFIGLRDLMRQDEERKKAKAKETHSAEIKS